MAPYWTLVTALGYGCSALVVLLCVLVIVRAVSRSLKATGGTISSRPALGEAERLFLTMCGITGLVYAAGVLIIWWIRRRLVIEMRSQRVPAP